MNLIYTVCMGVQYFFDLTQEMIDACRRQGYVGDLFIITDREYHFDGAETIVLPKAEHRMLWKASLHKVVDCERYEKILYIDSDIVPIRNLDAVFALDGIRFPLEPIPMSVSGLNRVYMTDMEKEIHKNDFGVNAGTFLLPGKQAKAFLQAFENGWIKYDPSAVPDFWPENKQYKNLMCDQSALQVMIIRGEIKIEPMPFGMVSFPGIKPVTCNSDVSLLHFCGPQQTALNKAAILEWMKMCRMDAQAACDSMAKSIHKWGGGKADMAILQESIGKLATAIAAFIEYNQTLEKRLSKLEEEKNVEQF